MGHIMTLSSQTRHDKRTGEAKPPKYALRQEWQRVMPAIAHVDGQQVFGQAAFKVKAAAAVQKGW